MKSGGPLLPTPDILALRVRDLAALVQRLQHCRRRVRVRDGDALVHDEAHAGGRLVDANLVAAALLAQQLGRRLFLGRGGAPPRRT